MQSESARLATDTWNKVPPSKNGTRVSCPYPASTTSQIQDEHVPELPHLTGHLCAISSLPWSCTSKPAVTATPGEVCKAISTVILPPGTGQH